MLLLAKEKPSRRHLAQPAISRIDETNQAVFGPFRQLEARFAESRSIFTTYSAELANAQSRAISFLKLEAAVRLTNAREESKLKEIESWATEVVKRIEESMEETIRLISTDTFHLPCRPVHVDLLLLSKGARFNWIMKATNGLSVCRVFGQLDSEFIEAYSLLIRAFDKIEHPNKIAEEVSSGQISLFVVKNEAGWVIATALKRGEELQIKVREEYKEPHVTAFLKAAIETDLRASS